MLALLLVFLASDAKYPGYHIDECGECRKGVCPQDTPFAFGSNFVLCCEFSEKRWDGGPLAEWHQTYHCTGKFTYCRSEKGCKSFPRLPRYYTLHKTCTNPVHVSSPQKHTSVWSRWPFAPLWPIFGPTWEYKLAQPLHSDVETRRLPATFDSNTCISCDHCYSHATGTVYRWIHLEHTSQDTGYDISKPSGDSWLEWSRKILVAAGKDHHNFCAQTGWAAPPGDFVGAHVLYKVGANYKIGILKTSKTCNTKARGGIWNGGSASLACAVYCAGKGMPANYKQKFKNSHELQFNNLMAGSSGYSGYSGNNFWHCDRIVERLDLNTVSATDFDNFWNQFVGINGWTFSSPTFNAQANNICSTWLQLC
jgi:hypothetical protein